MRKIPMWYCPDCGYFKSEIIIDFDTEHRFTICPKCGMLVSYREYPKWR